MVDDESHCTKKEIRLRWIRITEFIDSDRQVEIAVKVVSGLVQKLLGRVPAT